MSPVLLLRIASGVAALQFFAHAGLFLTSKPRHGPEEVAVIETMKAHRFDFLGSKRSYWDFYFGYGLLAALACLIQAVLFWFLAGLLATGPVPIRPIITLFFFANAAHAGLALRYFFLTPVIPDVVIAGILAFAFFAAG